MSKSKRDECKAVMVGVCSALAVVGGVGAADNLRVNKASLSIGLAPDAVVQVTNATLAIDALGKTDWFQGMWPSDATMPYPKFPRFHVTPVLASDTGVALIKKLPLDPDLEALEPTINLLLESGGKTFPFYGGGPQAQIAYRVGNLLRIVDTSAPTARSLEMLVASHRLVVLRMRAAGKPATVRLDIEARVRETDANQTGVTSAGRSWVTANARGWHGVELFAGKSAAEAFAVVAYDSTTPEEMAAALAEGARQAAQFDACWAKLARPHAVEPFLAGGETPDDVNLIAACVNRVLRNARGGGFMVSPSMVEFFGPEWENADAVWINFQPACRYALWIEPSLWANSMRTLFGQQAADGRVPQCVYPSHEHGQHNSQYPNISPCLRDYYTFTRDRAFLQEHYPRLKRWYQWWLEKRNPTGDGIIAAGTDSQNLWDAICEYKDNQTDPANAGEFANTCNPLTRTPEIGGRPNRVYLPDILASQARMAEDLAFMASELGNREDAAHFAAEYGRLRDWANTNMWDEATKFYYPVVRATGKKLMKRSNVAFWLLWAGIPDARRKDALVESLFDPKQFFTAIPVPMIAISDPSFNPKCGHWGDGYGWPIDAFHAFDGLLRYGEWEKAARFAEHYNRGVFQAIRETRQPNEYYHHSGQAAGNSIMGTAGCLPLTFARYLRDYRRGVAQKEWAKFAPAPLHETPNGKP